MATLRYTRLTNNAYPPKKGCAKSAGYDLFSAYACMVPAGGRTVIATDLALDIPDGYYGQIVERSSLAATYGIQVGGGIIDSGFRGNVRVVLLNHGVSHYRIYRGSRIAQLILQPITVTALQEVDALETGCKLLVSCLLRSRSTVFVLYAQ
jgi:dUTP pyrophosphatase